MPLERQSVNCKGSSLSLSLGFAFCSASASVAAIACCRPCLCLFVWLRDLGCPQALREGRFFGLGTWALEWEQAGGALY